MNYIQDEFKCVKCGGLEHNNPNVTYLCQTHINLHKKAMEVQEAQDKYDALIGMLGKIVILLELVVQNTATSKKGGKNV